MRKFSLSVILILLIVGCYQVLFGNSEIIRSKVASVSQLQASSKKLNTEVATLEKRTTDEFNTQKAELSNIIENYRNTKVEYDNVVARLSAEAAEALIAIQENDLKDIYDVDFLWTIIGNYATEEGVNLKFDVTRNTTSALSLSNTSTNYVVCDLKFVITGNYINLTDFIYDLEDDDRLNFEINDFDMKKLGTDLEVTLRVREVKINSDNLIETSTYVPEEAEELMPNDLQTIDSEMNNEIEKNNTTAQKNNVN